MSFKKINNITGWAVCLIACLVYLLTMEASGSLWDCGEFASAAYKLQIPHPPGAPLFVLMGRLFMAPFGPENAVTGLNMMSALSSGFTILFLFWTITHFARKAVAGVSVELTNQQTFIVMAAGAVGALCYTFSDSFWYSAVEAEVYALSSFFTALVFWCMVKWEQAVTIEEAEGIKGHFTHADKWIILIFFLMGLSIGVHLLNLLTIPAMVMIYYFKRYQSSTWGAIFAFLIGCVLTGLVQKAVIQWSIKGAGNMDILFVNSFGASYFIGFAFFFVIIALAVYFGLKIASKRNWNFLKLGLWSFIFMLLGYSTYFTTLIRSSADPSVDMFNVDNPVSLVGYVGREQYGDWPILYGQDFTADVLRDANGNPDVNDDGVTYIKGKDEDGNNRYVEGGKKVSYKYAAEDKHFFPRMWDQSNDQGHADYYAQFAGIAKDKDGKYERSPTMSENLYYFFSYQLNWMYWRYFMWNFAGKQNDVQGISSSNVRDGNWKTGIGFYDNIRLGDQSTLPETLRNNKANNKLFALPFILGLLGILYQYKQGKKDLLVTGLLFFFTGFAICIYLNQAGNQPRERDYAYVGSFYAFAIWVGLGVIYVRDLINKLAKNISTSNVAAAVLCMLAVPVLMASQEWDDHNRSNKRIATDLAIDYLESCAPNAILITFGDNDTYPLWYAQEVQGIRKDVRVINNSLLGTDWYVNQLRYKVNDSEPIDAIWTPEQIQGSKRDVIYNAPPPGWNPNTSIDLYTMMKDWAGSDAEGKAMRRADGIYNLFPTGNVTVPVNDSIVRANGTVGASDTGIVSQLSFTITKSALLKNDATILNIIAANNWKRPIYFTSDYKELGFGKYLRQDGMTYRLVPIQDGQVNNDWAYDKMMNKFKFGNANVSGVYFDEENRRHLNSIRLAYSQAAISLAISGKKEEAKRLLNKCDTMMNQGNMPYGMASRYQQQNQFSLQFLQAAYLAEDQKLIAKISAALTKDMMEQQLFYQNLSDIKRENMSEEEQRNEFLLDRLNKMKAQYAQPIVPNVENPGVIKNSGK